MLAELVAYPYGQRNDTLSEQIIGSLDQKAKDAEQTAEKALGDSATAITQSGQATGEAKSAELEAGGAKSSADKAASAASRASGAASDALSLASGARKETQLVDQDLESAKKDLESAKQKLLRDGPRAALLSDPKTRENIMSALVPFPGQKVDILTSSMYRPEVGELESYLISIVTAPVNWELEERRIDATLTMPGGVVVFIGPTATKSTRDAATALGTALKSVGLIEFKPVETLQSIAPLTALAPADTVLLWIGEHP